MGNARINEESFRDVWIRTRDRWLALPDDPDSTETPKAKLPLIVGHFDAIAEENAKDIGTRVEYRMDNNNRINLNQLEQEELKPKAHMALDWLFFMGKVMQAEDYFPDELITDTQRIELRRIVANVEERHAIHNDLIFNYPLSARKRLILDVLIANNRIEFILGDNVLKAVSS